MTSRSCLCRNVAKAWTLSPRSKTNGRGGKNNDTTSEIRAQWKFLPLSFIRNRIARRKKMKSWAIKIVDWIVNLRFHQSFSRLAKKNLRPRSAWTSDTNKNTQQSWEIARAAHWQQKTAMPAHTTSPIEFGAMCCTLVVVVLFAVARRTPREWDKNGIRIRTLGSAECSTARSLPFVKHFIISKLKTVAITFALLLFRTLLCAFDYGTMAKKI